MGRRTAAAAWALTVYHRCDPAAGRPPLHIIVNRGTITLLGVVDTESDKTVAGMRAGDVPASSSWSVARVRDVPLVAV